MTEEPNGSPEVTPRNRRRGAGAWRESFRWVGLGCVLLIVFVVGLSLIKIPAPQPLELQSQAAGRMGIGLTSVMKAEVDLLDPTPLFLPTKHNAGSAIGPKKQQMASQGNFQSFPPNLVNVNPAGTLELNFPPVVDVPASPADGLRVGLVPNPYRSLGKADEESVALPQRLGFLEIVPAGGGSSIARVLQGMPEPGFGDWHPMEWMATIDRRGLMGNLALVVSSGVEECDAFFRRYLTDQLRMGDRLAPGIYRLRVGP